VVAVGTVDDYHLNDHHEWSREQIAIRLEENGGQQLAP